MDIKEIKEKVAFWQKIEDEGGSPTSAKKLAAFKEMLKEAEPAKPAKKAKKEEPVIDDWNEDDAIAEADEEE